MGNLNLKRGRKLVWQPPGDYNPITLGISGFSVVDAMKIKSLRGSDGDESGAGVFVMEKIRDSIIWWDGVDGEDGLAECNQANKEALLAMYPALITEITNFIVSISAEGVQRKNVSGGEFEKSSPPLSKAETG